MSSSDPQASSASPAGAPLGSRPRRSPARVVLSSLAVSLAAVSLAALPACNAVLGIDDATLCSEGSCDGGVPAFSAEVAPNLPGRGNGADAGDDGDAIPGAGNEIP